MARTFHCSSSWSAPAVRSAAGGGKCHGAAEPRRKGEIQRSSVLMAGHAQPRSVRPVPIFRCTMAKKPKGAAKEANIKEQLEAIVGHKIDVSEQQLAKFSYPVGLFSYGWGAAISKSVFPFPRK